MAICNVFNTLTKQTGTFLTFSQYMEDLTRWQTEASNYKIVPSKFVAIDCNPTNYTNITLPKLFQEYFENACACFKNASIYKSDEIDPKGISGWTPEYSKTLFWNMMFNHPDKDTNSGLIKIEDIKYVGDINLHSYNDVDGMGYSEIYCHIPNEAPAYQYEVSKESQDLNIIKVIAGDVLTGLQIGELNGNEVLSRDYEYELGNTYKFTWEQTEKLQSLEDKSFNINMIIVLYDIYNDINIAYSGIPMGVYITGLIEDGKIQNSITKYVSNEDIYNSGTSYGLRICSRYVVSPERDNYVIKDITCEDNNYGDLSRVLTQMSISQAKMDEIINHNYCSNQNYKDLLSIFTNSRTNVPYIKTVNGEGYWFVNGRMLGPTTSNNESYTNTELDALLGSLGKASMQSFQIFATATDKNNQYIFNKHDSDSKNKTITLQWQVYYEGQLVHPNKLTIKINDGESIDAHNYSYLQFKDVNETTTYTISAELEYEKVKTSTSVTVYFVEPSYFGELAYSASELTNKNAEEIEKLITELQIFVSNTRQQSHKITTNMYNAGHVCYAYPESMGELLSIQDTNGHIYYSKDGDELYNQFDMMTVNIDGVRYYVYIDEEPVYQHDQLLKFK